jgi:hypothetical protein
MIHGDLPWVGTRVSPERGTQLVRANMLSGANMRYESEIMISLRRKYIERYPQLREVEDNLFQLIEFFMYHNIKLEEKDRVDFYKVLHKAGSTLPSLHYLASCILNFQKEFSNIFLLPEITKS